MQERFWRELARRRRSRRWLAGRKTGQRAIYDGEAVGREPCFIECNEEVRRVYASRSHAKRLMERWFKREASRQADRRADGEPW